MSSHVLRHGRTRAVISVSLVLTLAACQAAAAPSSSTPVPSEAPSTAATQVPSVAPDPTVRLPDHVVAQWSIDNPSFVAFAFGSVWVPNHYGNEITRIDPATNTIQAVIKGTGNNPESALEVGGALWVTGQHDDMVLIDPVTNAVVKTVPGAHLFMDAGFGSVWITTRDNHVERFDPATATIVSTIPVGEGSSDCMNGVVGRAASVWVFQCDRGELIRIDPVTSRVTSTTSFATLGKEAKAATGTLAATATDSIWLEVGGGDLPTGLMRVSTITGDGLSFLPLTPELQGDGELAVSDDAVWLGGSEEYSRVDIATGKIVATYPTDPGRLKLGVAFGSVWLRNFEQGLIQRLDVAP